MSPAVVGSGVAVDTVLRPILTVSRARKVTPETDNVKVPSEKLTFPAPKEFVEERNVANVKGWVESVKTSNIPPPKLALKPPLVAGLVRTKSVAPKFAVKLWLLLSVSVNSTPEPSVAEAALHEKTSVGFAHVIVSPVIVPACAAGIIRNRTDGKSVNRWKVGVLIYIGL
jgi:hypothetical protein